jgi:hypothetical protein
MIFYQNGEYKVVVDVKNSDDSYIKKEFSLHEKVTKGLFKDTVRV